MRRLVSGLASVLIVLAMAAYVLVEPDAAVELGIEEVSADLAYDEAVEAEYSLAAAEVAAAGRYRQVVYGVIHSPSGVPVTNGRLQIRGVGKRVKGSRATIRIGRADRTYRARVHLTPGRYRFTVRLEAAGRPRSASKVVRLRDGRAYRASVTVRESGIITMLPISSY